MFYYVRSSFNDETNIQYVIMRSLTYMSMDSKDVTKSSATYVSVDSHIVIMMSATYMSMDSG